MSELFAGIGGFSLGFRRAGFDVVYQVEIDPFCRKVLKKNFPEAEHFKDVREVGKHNLKPVDVICGGFPCQDISYAGKGAGIEGERSGLWREFARIIGELRPRYAVVENVPALLTRGLGRVLGDLAEIGYDAEWEVISAADVGAPHLRERIWIVAYPHVTGLERRQRPIMRKCTGERVTRASYPSQVAYSHRTERETCLTESSGRGSTEAGNSGVAHSRPSMADSFLEQWNGRLYWTCGWSREPEEVVRNVGRGRGQENGLPITESLLGRVAYGIPDRVDRLRALGNAVVPQITEWIAHRILEAETSKDS